MRRKNPTKTLRKGLSLFFLGVTQCFIGHSEEMNRPKIKQGTYFGRTTKAGASVSIAYPADWDGCSANDQIQLWWRNWEWDEKSDAPYAKATHEIDAAVKAGVNPLVLVNRYKSEISKDRWNPLKNYRWAYAAWMARKKPKAKIKSDSIILPLIAQLSEIKFPSSYHYARIGFLINAYKSPTPCLKRLGDRLLNRDPKDEDVKFYMIRVLRNTMDPQDDQRALSYLRFFQTQYPQNTYYAREYALTRNRFFDRAYPLEQEKANMAIAAFDAYNKVAPTVAEKRWSQQMNADIERQMRNWSLYGYTYWVRQKK